MKKDLIVKLHASFEDIVQRHAETATEFWLARVLQTVLGYVRWENLAKIIDKAKASCEAAGNLVDDHFRDVTKMVSLSSGSQRALLSDRGIVPEQLPPAEDLKKIERRHTAEAKNLPKTAERLGDE